MRVALYARYSDDRQNERSIADQVEILTRHCAARGWTVSAVFTDAAISGAAMANRPGVLSMLEAVAGGAFDRVLVEDTDRLARDREYDAHIYKRLTWANVILSTLTSDVVTPMESTFKGLINEDFLRGLSQKTKRGMHSNAEKGLATGSRLYGYRSAPGGETGIVAEEAEVIRRIFRTYAAGDTARDIATALNREAVPGPRGGAWNASTINGTRQRANGILNTDLYAGVKVWNRMDVRKHPVTGKRTPLIRPREAWRTVAVPHLRIVPEDLWETVRARKAADGTFRPHQLANRRKPGVFSGLLKCGACGAGYTVYRRGMLICAAYREKGEAVCDNRREVKRAELEGRILEGLKSRLLAPEAVAAYVRAYHAAWTEAASRRVSRRAGIERRIAELKRTECRYVDAVEQGRASQAMYDRAIAAETERAGLEAELADQGAPETIALHPEAPRAYAALVERLQAHLAEMSADPADPDARPVIDAVRGLVLKIDVGPGLDESGRIALTLHGELSRFLQSPGTSPDPWRSQVVAGGGIEPPTCGL